MKSTSPYSLVVFDFNKIAFLKLFQNVLYMHERDHIFDNGEFSSDFSYLSLSCSPYLSTPAIPPFHFCFFHFFSLYQTTRSSTQHNSCDYCVTVVVLKKPCSVQENYICISTRLSSHNTYITLIQSQNGLKINFE